VAGSRFKTTYCHDPSALHLTGLSGCAHYINGLPGLLVAKAPLFPRKGDADCQERPYFSGEL